MTQCTISSMGLSDQVSTCPLSNDYLNIFLELTLKWASRRIVPQYPHHFPFRSHYFRSKCSVSDFARWWNNTAVDIDVDFAVAVTVDIDVDLYVAVYLLIFLLHFYVAVYLLVVEVFCGWSCTFMLQCSTRERCFPATEKLLSWKMMEKTGGRMRLSFYSFSLSLTS